MRRARAARAATAAAAERACTRDALSATLRGGEHVAERDSAMPPSPATTGDSSDFATREPACSASARQRFSDGIGRACRRCPTGRARATSSRSPSRLRRAVARMSTLARSSAGAHVARAGDRCCIAQARLAECHVLATIVLCAIAPRRVQASCNPVHNSVGRACAVGLLMVTSRLAGRRSGGQNRSQIRKRSRSKSARRTARSPRVRSGSRA